jgi:hypothetical protein
MTVGRVAMPTLLALTLAGCGGPAAGGGEIEGINPIGTLPQPCEYPMDGHGMQSTNACITPGGQVLMSPGIGRR